MVAKRRFENKSIGAWYNDNSNAVSQGMAREERSMKDPLLPLI